MEIHKQGCRRRKTEAPPIPHPPSPPPPGRDRCIARGVRHRRGFYCGQRERWVPRRELSLSLPGHVRQVHGRSTMQHKRERRRRKIPSNPRREANEKFLRNLATRNNSQTVFMSDSPLVEGAR